MAIVVIVGAALVIGPATVGSDDRTITARFDTAAGLYTGNPVDILGIHVGSISSIRHTPEYAEVVMSVKSDVKIPADASAVVVSDSVMTERHIEFTPPYRGGPTMRGGAVIGLERTKTPVQFDALLTMANRLTASLNGDGEGKGPLANIIATGAAATAGNGVELRGALDELSKALKMGDGGGAATRDAITTIVKNLDSLTTAAAQNDASIRQFGSGISTLTQLLDDQELGTGTTGSKLVQILAATTDLMDKYRGKISQTLGGADVALKSVADNRQNIASFFDQFPLAADNAFAIVDPTLRAGRAHVNLDRLLLDGQTLKYICNVLNLKNLGCNTGKASDMGPDFGVTAMLAGLAGLKR